MFNKDFVRPAWFGSISRFRSTFAVSQSTLRARHMHNKNSDSQTQESSAVASHVRTNKQHPVVFKKSNQRTLRYNCAHRRTENSKTPAHNVNRANSACVYHWRDCFPRAVPRRASCPIATSSVKILVRRATFEL